MLRKLSDSTRRVRCGIGWPGTRFMFWTIFFAVLLALVVNDARRDMHKTMKGWIAEAESRGSHHNELMQFSQPWVVQKRGWPCPPFLLQPTKGGSSILVPAL
jgi:hypothetical protein